MKIETHFCPRSTLEEFAEKHCLVMEVHERDPHTLGWRPDLPRFFACFKGVDVREGPFSVAIAGNGNSPEEAIADYGKRISGRSLMLGRFTGSATLVEAPIFEGNDDKPRSV